MLTPGAESDQLLACPLCRRSWDPAWQGKACQECGAPGRPIDDVTPPAPHLAAVSEDTEPHLRFATGGSFILDTPAEPVPVWGQGQSVLWAEGEALTIVGGQGVGKTTLAQQLALARTGLPDFSEVLGFPVSYEACGRVLYLAMDRPRQAARSFRRMVKESMREDLDDLLWIWEGPPVVDIAKNPSTLVGYAKAANACTIVVDSIKDAALKLSDDEVGGGWNRARQIALRARVQIIEVHHNRKLQSGVKEHPSLDSVYGSTWITSGSGSVVLLSGAPGDPIVNLHHLKQPSEEVGPLKVIHDHDAGRSSVWHSVDLLSACHAQPGGMTAVDAARLLFDSDKPSAAEKEKARRKLDRLVNEGLVSILDEGDAGQKRSKRWGR